jgi:hypothetical protein
VRHDRDGNIGLTALLLTLLIVGYLVFKVLQSGSAGSVANAIAPKPIMDQIQRDVEHVEDAIKQREALPDTPVE